MAVTAAPYASFLLGLSRAQFNLESDPLLIALAGASYLPNMSTDATLTDVDDLVSAADPITLTGRTATYSSTTFTVRVSADPVTWSAATFTTRWAVIYESGGALIGYIDFGGERVSSSEDFTLTFPDGFVQIPAV